MIPPILMIHLELENPTDEPQTVFLEKGRCFEILSPNAELQNAALAEDTELVIPAHDKLKVDLPAFCLNQYRRMTRKINDATITPFLLDDDCADQFQVWNKMTDSALN